jgi:hypothetical protein
MLPFDDLRSASAPPLNWGARWLLRRVCTDNPFYVLSAALFLVGLWGSFTAQDGAEQTWALLSGLSGYTILLAVTACLLVRFGNVWDDVRTVLLLVVLMFLATSVTFDAVLVDNPDRGMICCTGGLLIAVMVSEGVLRGIRLALPAWFRGPYYLILALFFLYPLALSPLLAEPHSEALMWGLFGFSPAAGLVFLTLLPAVRRGPRYVRNNGSPWRWPLYPWALFGVLGLAVPARAFLLCWSLHLLGGADLDRLIFGPYFLTPFGLCVAILLLETGIVSRKRSVHAVALVAPLGLIALALIGHRPDPIYRGFLEVFTARLGGDPLFLALLAAAGFYAYAAVRRVPLATELLTAVLAALAVVGPDTLDRGDFAAPQPAPILAAALLQLGLGLWRRSAWRCLLGGSGLAITVALVVPEGTIAASHRDLVAFHLILAAVLGVGAGFEGFLARTLRLAGALLVLLAGVAATFGGVDVPEGIPPWAAVAYPLALAFLVATYGLILAHRPSFAVAGMVLACWLATAGWQGYCSLRQLVTGLDHIALSLGLFGVAILVSLAKSGVLARWLPGRVRQVPDSTG